MAYEILVSLLARRDIVETADYIKEKGNPERARKWKTALLRELKTLAEMPNRCSLADESEEVGLELRELHYRSHRILFIVNEAVQCVQILRIYHSARSPLHLEDFE